MRNYVKSLISSNKFCSPGSRNGFYSQANKICSLKPPPIRFREIKNCKQIANGIHICLDLSSRARSGDWKNCSLRYLTSFVHITMDRLFASSAPSSGGRPLYSQALTFWSRMRVRSIILKTIDRTAVIVSTHYWRLALTGWKVKNIILINLELSFINIIKRIDMVNERDSCMKFFNFLIISW